MSDQPYSDAALLELRVQTPAPPEEVLAARRMLNAAIEAERRRGRRPARRWLVAAASSAAAVVAIVAVALSVTSVRAPSATALLFDLVGKVTREAPIAQADGQFVHVRTEGEVLAGTQVTTDAGAAVDLVWLQPFEEERWYAEDGSFRLRRVPGEPRFFDDEAAARYRADPTLQGALQPELVIDSAAPDLEVVLDDLPLETAALRQALIDEFQLAGTERPIEGELLSRSAQLAARYDASPGLRAALLTLMADTEGLEVFDRSRDTVTVGLTYDAGATAETVRLEYVFGRESGRLVESRVVTVDPPAETGIPAGTVSFVRYDAPVVVDELGP